MNNANRYKILVSILLTLASYSNLSLQKILIFLSYKNVLFLMGDFEHTTLKCSKQLQARLKIIRSIKFIFQRIFTALQTAAQFLATCYSKLKRINFRTSYPFFKSLPYLQNRVESPNNFQIPKKEIIYVQIRLKGS